MIQYEHNGVCDDSFAAELRRLQDQMDYRFHDGEILVRALTHRSFANEQGKDIPDYQRLEFLGDSVLDLILALELMRRFPSASEGELTQMRAALVSEQMLSDMARSLDLGACLRLGRGEEQTGGRERNSMLADAYEALMGAVFLDGGFESAAQTIIQLFCQPLKEVSKEDFRRDFKSDLQHWVQERFRETPDYVVTDQWGPAHQRGFQVELRLHGRVLGVGVGSSKKEAEQAAARHALEQLQSDFKSGASLQ